MEVARMKAERRTALGRNQIQKLRQEGWMPAVVYGGEGKEPVSIQISEWELEQHIKHHHRIYELDIAGQTESAFLQDVSWKAINDRPLHADFLRIDLSKPVETDIEVSLLGHPAGVTKGGVLIKDHLMVRIKALPTKLPEGHELDVSGLNVGDAVHAKDLQLPEGVELVSDGDMPICHVSGSAQTAGDEVADAVAELEADSGGAEPGDAAGGDAEKS